MQSLGELERTALEQLWDAAGPLTPGELRDRLATGDQLSACLDRLEGMYAFAAYDARTRSFKEFMNEWVTEQFMKNLAEFDLEKPWFWDLFIEELDYAHHSLQLDIEAGTGTVSDQGADPQVMLRWSDDGGHTWSNEHWVPMGKVGEYYRRVIWRRLGMTLKLRDRVYEVSGTDPVKIAIMGAELIMSPTNA